MRKLIPLLMALLGLGLGGAAGLFFTASSGQEEATNTPPLPNENAPLEYVKISNQFIVPLLENGRVASLVVLSLGLEVGLGQSDAVMAKEPKLRDAFLQVLFDHAHMGGFRGAFTDASQLNTLRKSLREEAQAIMGSAVVEVLITEIGRQDS